MKSGAAVPTAFYDAALDVTAVSHGDDLLFEADDEQGTAAIEKLRTRVDLVVKYKLARSRATTSKRCCSTGCCRGRTRG